MVNIMDERVGGDWKLVKILGSGGFGQVTLWCNQATGQKIAIKRLLESSLKDTTVKSKLTERWCNEVEIMKKLNHSNIIAAVETPFEFNVGNSLPVLAMEYCSSGDLRQVLNRAENCCGLQESQILHILKDISSGLAYLHFCKIIHRDIKPDNIVLQEKGASTIYKLIDLGYAKALDESSLSKSFVGTIQYIAPELFMGKEYTSSVDYWSFGLMTHEIITGYRPFLPGRSPSDWMKQIQNKPRDVICVLENNGHIMFNSKISRENHLSRCFLEDIEKWLQLALDWDGHTRGRDVEENRVVIFENLTAILCKKLITVFSLPTYERLIYEVKEESEVCDLRVWLKEKTGVEEEEQLLLLPSGKCLSMNGNLLKNLETEKVDRSSVSLYLYNSGLVSMITDKMKTPSFFEEFQRSSKDHLCRKQLKRHCADAVYFVQSQATLYRNLLQGIKVKITHTKQKTLAIESLHGDLENDWNRIEYYAHFLSFSHKIDLESYIHYRKTGKLKSSLFVRKWIQNVIDVNNKITELKTSFNKSKPRQLMILAKQHCKNLDEHSTGNGNQRTPLDSLVDKGQKLWESVKKTKNDEECQIFYSNIVDLVNKTLEETSRVVKSQMLDALFVKIWKADENLARFLTHLTNMYKSMNILKTVIEHTQAERQKEVWTLIENGNSDSAKEVGGSEESNRNNSVSGMSQSFIGKESESELINKPESPVLGFGLSLLNVTGASTVIEDNSRLRYRIQEAQQSCSRMMNEISSLNWDYILEPQ